MLEIIRPEIFDYQKLQAGVTTVNKRMFPKYGLTLSSFDTPDDVDFNLHLQLFAHSRGISAEQIKFNKQIHSDIVRIVDEDSDVEEADGLVTNKKNLMLLVKIADCAAVLMHDVENEVIAAVHSGWRGSKLNITSKAIKLMQKNYGTRPENLLCYISPAASVNKYEVGKEFTKIFPLTTVKRGGKYYFDNKKEIFNQLIAAGVAKENIEVSPVCTIKDKNFHSYRRDKDKSGRMGAFIMLK